MMEKPDVWTWFRFLLSYWFSLVWSYFPNVHNPGFQNFFIGVASGFIKKYN